MPTSKCIGGIMRVRRSSGGCLEKMQVDQPLLSNASAIRERVAGPSRISDNVSPFSLAAPQQTRGFHTSPPAPYYSTSYNTADVPEFFIKYKQYRVAPPVDSKVHEQKHEEPGLLSALTDAILAGDVVANTRRLTAKVPVEHHAGDGCIVHTSGFVAPGPGHKCMSNVARAKERDRDEDKDRLAQTAAVANRVLESDFEKVDATTLPSLHKVPFEVHELDGTIKHASGYVPPTPAHKFRYPVNTALWERKVSAVRQRPRQPSPSRAVLRALHSASAQNAVEVI